MSTPPAIQTTTMHPNILLILMDAARAKNLSCYGYHRPTTPNLERFAERCVIYETAISPGGWSLPSHVSIFTELYPSRHGAHDQHKYLLSKYPAMAKLLHSQGYHTLALCDNVYVGTATGLDRGFEEFNPVFENLPRSLKRAKRKAENGIATLLGLCDSGARFINKQVSIALRQLQANERPFFMFVHYREPHTPYHLPNKYNRYLPARVSPAAARCVNQDQWKYFDPASMDERDFEILTALYDGEITCLDMRVAQVLRWLEESGMLDRTLVIITTDHGENVGDHQLMGHQYCLYDTLLHVPLIIHYPKGMAVPGRVKHQVQTLDLLPTILAMLSDTWSKVYRSLQGHNLLSSARHTFTVVEDLAQRLMEWYNSFETATPLDQASEFDETIKERLRALGYLE